MKRRYARQEVILAVAIAAALGIAGCGGRSMPSQVQEPDEATLERQQQQGLAANEAIKNRLEPFIQVRDGRFMVLPGATSVVDPDIVRAVEEHVTNLNSLAQKGDLVIEADRQITPWPSGADKQTLGCWRGVQTRWWGWYIGMSDADIHAILRGFSNIDRMRSALGPIGVTIPWQVNLFYNVLKYNLKVFDQYICRHSCETVTIYYWAIPTPFLNCQ
jgi:hypothetical protein